MITLPKPQPGEDGTVFHLGSPSLDLAVLTSSVRSHEGVGTSLTVPPCQLAHLKYALLAALPTHDGANLLRSEVIPRLLAFVFLPKPQYGPA